MSRLTRTDSSSFANFEKLSKVFFHLKKENTKMLPTLYSKAKTGKLMQWRVWTEGDEIIKEFGYKGGKLREVRTKAKPKNSGKTNGTTAEEQAVSEAKADWTKQLDKGYFADEEDEEASLFVSGVLQAKEESGGNNHNIMDKKVSAPRKDQKKIFLPMLAEKYNELMAPSKGKRRAQKFEYSKASCAQPKLDGVRCVARIVDGNVQLLSRKGKQILHLEHIRAEISELLSGKEEMILDGELYFHESDLPQNKKFELISGAARSTRNKPHPDELLVQYWVFDIADTEKIWFDRDYELDLLFKDKEMEYIVRVETELVLCEEDMLEHHRRWTDEGFEGTILRDERLMYTPGKRSRLLLKYKDFCDSEYRIIGVLKSEGGTEDGAAIFALKTDNGTEFTCRPMGTIEERRKIYKNKKEYIGKLLTVKYQGISQDGVPRFPVGKTLRDENF
ncbi:ATP-dependent DNA ligase [Brazilian marseillevirus]|uniref:ATP-dependent DNA ligase n=1 Tax=Brazilian marseillevirus TaxID=1813599 RepID=UPI000781D253|nr:ATP-dependent DNA ligase [Brazilian marseillevirus]AMQ10593.1 ATP-dependent DNA ligase [Brazilian marseillevirus]